VEVPPPPGDSDRYQTKGLTRIGIRKSIKTKDMQIDIFEK
jgi:hypothetical protein